MKIIELKETFTASNDRDAEELRAYLKEKSVILFNLMSAPGSGKTTLLSRIITDLRGKASIAVMEADIASAVDAERIEALGAQAVQVHTDGMCHMDAGMTREGLLPMDLSGVDMIFLENVGNLICPAEYDTGAVKNIMILSVPEGDDKPLKYPLMFRESDALVITKTDALPYFNFDMEKAMERALRLNPDIKIFPVSAKKGDGMAALEDWLLEETRQFINQLTFAEHILEDLEVSRRQVSQGKVRNMAEALEDLRKRHGFI
ncbi:MAG: hydrogenase nickel incorporation protein HypB [Flexilinea sp.]|nr:hydrogenase nickel incorporation protein HypB [Flexilinea sp.]